MKNAEENLEVRIEQNSELEPRCLLHSLHGKINTAQLADMASKVSEELPVAASAVNAVVGVVAPESLPLVVEVEHIIEIAATEVATIAAAVSAANRPVNVSSSSSSDTVNDEADDAKSHPAKRLKLS